MLYEVITLARQVKALKVGPGTLPGVEMGPLVTREHFEKVRGYVDLGIEEGAKLVCDGRGLKVPGHEQGFVITSYSIHYTKLYEAIRRPSRPAGVPRCPRT